jgi:hypothetical protein
MIKRASLFLFILTFLAASAVFSQTHKRALLNFSDLQKFDGVNATFRIEGYIFDVYRCPPCPKGAMCKPCIPDNVVISDKIDQKDMSSIKRLRIYTKDTDQFTLKKRYIFTLKIRGDLEKGKPIENIDLVNFKAL